VFCGERRPESLARKLGANDKISLRQRPRKQKTAEVRFRKVIIASSTAKTAQFAPMVGSVIENVQGDVRKGKLKGLAGGSTKRNDSVNLGGEQSFPA